MNSTAQPVPQRVLVVTLADLGDALLTTPALHSLRCALPHAHIGVLTTPAGAKALQGSGIEGQGSGIRDPGSRDRGIHRDQIDQPFDELIVFTKHRLDHPRALLRWSNLRYAWQLWQHLRSTQYDACIIFHHLTTWFGTLKYAVLACALGATQRYGLDNGRGFFLTHRAPDHGFGVHHQAEYWQQIVGLSGAPSNWRPPSFAFSADDARTANALLASIGNPKSAIPNRQSQIGNLIALHPGAGAFAPARRWPPQRWATLADTLISDGVQVVLVGGPEEEDVRRRMLGAMQHADRIVDLGGCTTLGQLAAVLQHCDLFIGNDSGVAHLAGSVGTPVVAVFGPTDPRAWGPYGGESWHVVQSWPNGVEVLQSGPHRALHAAIACSPCIYRGHSLGTPAGCPDRTCLLRIDVEQVLALVRERLWEMSSCTTGLLQDHRH